MAEIYQLPASDGRSSVVEMGDGSRRYRKQLVKFGSFVNPNEPAKKMVLDQSWAEKVVKNFKDRVLNRVPVAEGHPKGSGELVTKTRGELAGMSIEKDGVWGELDIKAPETAEAIDNDQIWDVSISFDPDYTDKASGANVGPALLHVGLVNDPYLKGMQPFQALSDNVNVIMLSESKESSMSKVKNDREFPVQIEYKDGDTEKSVTIAPGEEVDVPEEALEAVHGQVKEATAPEPTDAEKEAAAKAAADKEAADKEAADAAAKEQADADAKAKADASKSDEQKELEATKKELSEAKTQLALSEAEKTYDILLKEGKIVPAQHDTFISLSTAATSGAISLADNSTTSLSELLTNFVKAAPKRISFGEDGAAGDEAEKTPYDELSDEEKAANERLGVTPEEYNEVNGGKSTKKEEAK